MSPWQIVIALTVWFLLGLAFWLVLVFAGVGFLPVGAARRVLAARQQYDIVRSGRDRRRRHRPGTVDRRRAIPV